jgi:hypothetical protein
VTAGLGGPGACLFFCGKRRLPPHPPCRPPPILCHSWRGALPAAAASATSEPTGTWGGRAPAPALSQRRGTTVQAARRLPPSGPAAPAAAAGCSAAGRWQRRCRLRGENMSDGISSARSCVLGTQVFTQRALGRRAAA